MSGLGHVSARLAIEALRAGVPNSEAVKRLGCPDEQIETRFHTALDNIVDATASGFAISGGFGSGKSHLLGFLRETALQRNFIVSTVTVSKETALSLPGVTYAAAMRSAVMQGVNDDAVTLALTKVARTEGAIESLDQWASSPEASISPVFRAVLYLLNRGIDAELRHAIETFLADGRPPLPPGSGAPAPPVPPLPPLRRALKDKGIRGLFDLAPVPATELVHQRMRFIPQLFCAADFSGWVVLLDELELIGRYGPLQRALAYATLAQWLGLDAANRIPGLLGVCAITDDFADAVIDAKQDRERIPQRLRDRAVPMLREAEQSLMAMQAIQEAIRLRAPDERDLYRHEQAARDCYTEAYGWVAPPAEIGARQANRTMRHHIRGWVIQWDMLRVAGITARVVESQFAPDYSEDDHLAETAKVVDEHRPAELRQSFVEDDPTMPLPACSDDRQADDPQHSTIDAQRGFDGARLTDSVTDFDPHG